MNRDKQNIKTTDWLIRGIPKEQLKREKQEAILSAYLELCMTYDEETKSIDFDATAEKMVAAGYRKSTDLAEEIFAEIEKTLNRKLSRSKPRYEELNCNEGSLSIWGHKDMGYFQGIISTAEDIQDFIAELKKKYIGKDTNVTTNTEEGK